jgi:hypothetical protein
MSRHSDPAMGGRLAGRSDIVGPGGQLNLALYVLPKFVKNMQGKGWVLHCWASQQWRPLDKTAVVSAGRGGTMTEANQ